MSIVMDQTAPVAAGFTSGALSGVSQTHLTPDGLVIDILVATILLAGYCYSVGGPAIALGRVKRANWGWILRDAVLPLGVPCIIGTLVLTLGWAAGLKGLPPPYSVIEEVTPWTLCFFSLTILTGSLGRTVGPHAKVWGTLLWGTIVVISLFASFLTIARFSDGWHSGLRPYSFAGFFSVIAVYISHATTRLG